MALQPGWAVVTTLLLALCGALGVVVWRLRRALHGRDLALQRLQAREAEARSLAEARRRFVHYLGHEARNLVTNLAGTLWLAEQPTGAPPPVLRALRASTHSLQDLLNCSLDNAQLDAGTFAVRPALLDIVELLQRVADEAAPLARPPAVVLVLDGELPARRHWVHDGVRLAQIGRAHV
jgi:signal transduction histidine kinase